MALMAGWILQNTRTMPAAPESHRAACAGRIESQVEHLAAEVGKGVVEDRVVVREIPLPSPRVWPARGERIACLFWTILAG